MDGARFDLHFAAQYSHVQSHGSKFCIKSHENSGNVIAIGIIELQLLFTRRCDYP